MVNSKVKCSIHKAHHTRNCLGRKGTRHHHSHMRWTEQMPGSLQAEVVVAVGWWAAQLPQLWAFSPPPPLCHDPEAEVLQFLFLQFACWSLILDPVQLSRSIIRGQLHGQSRMEGVAEGRPWKKKEEGIWVLFIYGDIGMSPKGREIERLLLTLKVTRKEEKRQDVVYRSKFGEILVKGYLEMPVCLGIQCINVRECHWE